MNELKENKNKLVVGIDCSTTAVKSIAFDNKGKIKASFTEPISLNSPKPNYYEQNPAEWWEAVQKTLIKITSAIDKNSISAVSISNQRETFVPLGPNYEVLRPAILWLDERCKSEVDSFTKLIGREEIHQITGKPADFAPVVYRLAWMKKNEPLLFSKIKMICDVHAYIVWKLTGSFKTSWASADPFGAFDLKKKKWSTPILKELNLKEEQFPETYAPGTVLGRITESASILIGLNKETKIVAGAGDGQSAGLGANVLRSDKAYLNLGTAAVAGVYGPELLISKSFRTMCSASERGYYYECSLRAGTFSIDWFITKILQVNPIENPEIYKELEIEAEKIPAGSEGLYFLPYLSGVMNPYWDINARGSFIGLSAGHTRGHLYRAILEGICFEQRFALQSVESVAGIEIKEVAVIGGGAKSNLWCNLLASILDKKILLPTNQEASCLGAGIAAFVGIKMYDSFSIAAAEMNSISETVKPDSNLCRDYKTQFNQYKEIYPALKKLLLYNK
ncbi:MAG: FGGY-family carbohydrate kinase [Melioribacteraceae bacterium]|nr:FGGY-family carbohydrate kinase [Melioribacteraceae bacterium]